MAYLVRRIMENSSQVGVLTIMRSHQNKAPVLSPMDIHAEKRRKGELQRDRSQQILTHQFFSISPMHQYNEEHLALMTALLKRQNQKS